MESSVLVKTFAILETLVGCDDNLPLAELSEQVSLPKPTVHRIVRDLALMGYVQRVGNGRYRLTDRFRRLAGGTAEQWLITVARPVLEHLHEQTGETVNLGTLRGGRVLYLQVLESRHPLRRMVKPGESELSYSTALGRAIVSQWPESRWTRLLQHKPLERRTEQTTVDPQKLRERLIEARETGVAIEVDENDVGVMCIGAPVCDALGVVGAISISAPSARVDEGTRQQFVEILRKATEELSADLQNKTVVSA